MNEVVNSLLADYVRTYDRIAPYRVQIRRAEYRAIMDTDENTRRDTLLRCIDLSHAVPENWNRKSLQWAKREGLVTPGSTSDQMYNVYRVFNYGAWFLPQHLLATKLLLGVGDLLKIAKFCAWYCETSEVPLGSFVSTLSRHRELLARSGRLRTQVLHVAKTLNDPTTARQIRNLCAKVLAEARAKPGSPKAGARPSKPPRSDGKSRTRKRKEPATPMKGDLPSFESLLLGPRSCEIEHAPALWKVMAESLVLPPPNDHATPARFNPCDGVRPAILASINGVLANPPRRLYVDHDVEKFCDQMFKRREIDYRAVLAAIVALESTSIPWIDQDGRSERFQNGVNALIRCSQVLFGSIQNSDAALLAYTWSAFSHWRYDGFRPSWLWELLDHTVALPPGLFQSLPLAARWDVLRFRESVARCGFGTLQEYVIDLDKALGIGHEFEAHIGEPWTLAMVPWVRSRADKARSLWLAVLNGAVTTSAPSPSGRMQKSIEELGDAVAASVIRGRISEWFKLFATPRQSFPGGMAEGVDSTIPFPTSARAMRGLIWACPRFADRGIVRDLGSLALRCFAKVAGRGPRCVLVGNAAIWALGQIPGPDALGQLAMLRVKVKFIPAQKAIEKALTAAATREGLPRAEIEELGVPTYGLTEVGVRREELGDTIVELAATGGEVSLKFFKKAVAAEDVNGKPKKSGRESRRDSAADGVAAKGKEIKSVPASVKKDFADDLKELKASAKDLASMLSAQRDRIDSMFLDNRAWPLKAWRERYLDHPVVGVIARRLIWSIGDARTSAIFADGSLVDQLGRPVDPPSDATVRLWHPVDAPTDEVLAWRRFVEEKQIRQPFKQAHREVYLLTDAERRTNTYSNRFAAHIVRQHQFHALCGQRNWRNRLRLFVDGEFPPPTKHLPQYGMRAEFWVQEAGEETLDSGAFVYLATDQVRFYRAEAAQITSNPQGGGGSFTSAAPDQEPIALENVPPLVLSEILRDCDLFVGVASVGNNPAWNDGGPGQFRDYWQNFSFGDLSATAQTRRDLLSRLVPRLKIAERCSLSDRFLIVRGNVRTYKIHLGSGNILMEPNDQYLCIVPSSSGAVGGAKSAGASGVFLPFEGDRTLSIILSKAFLLATDDAITDTTITRQIKHD